MRANLYTLQGTATLLGRTQERLATGKKVNSALDDPAKYFAAQNHTARASDLDRLKAGMGESIQTIKAADKGISGIISLLEQARGLADSARSQDAAGRAVLETQFDALITQAEELAADSNYKGLNLLDGDTLTVQFEGAHTLTVTGVAADGAGYLGDITAAALADETEIANAIDEINTAVSAFRSAAATLAANMSVITTRQEFTQGMIDVLQTGAEKLTEADTNEEGANMLALQTRNQLGIISLQLASEASQSILRLF
jgi:flagellin-like hook-associated protein FlgL